MIDDKRIAQWRELCETGKWCATEGDRCLDGDEAIQFAEAVTTLLDERTELLDIIATFYKWQAHFVQNLMPNGLGNRVVAILGEGATDKLLDETA